MNRWSTLLFLALTLLAPGTTRAAETKPMKPAPAPARPDATPATHALERITIGGGCFWCLEAVFQRLPGVVKVVSGYAGGATAHPTYEQICTGDTGHAEVVQLTFDPTKISYPKLLEVFWAAHDPTTVLDRDTFAHGKLMPKGTPYQGNDVGTQYRSAIYYETEAQKAAALESRTVAQKEFPRPIATEIAPLKVFYPAEEYHQNYYNQNAARNPYCSAVISPKLKKLLAKGLITEPDHSATTR